MYFFTLGSITTDLISMQRCNRRGTKSSFISSESRYHCRRSIWLVYTLCCSQSGRAACFFIKMHCTPIRIGWHLKWFGQSQEVTLAYQVASDQDNCLPAMTSVSIIMDFLLCGSPLKDRPQGSSHGAELTLSFSCSLIWLQISSLPAW